MTRIRAVFACVPFVAAMSACGKGDRGDPGTSASGSVAQAPTPPPIDAAVAPPLDVPFQLPEAHTLARLPEKPAAYIFVAADSKMRVGATPSWAAATEAAGLDAVVKLVPPNPNQPLLPDDPNGTSGTIGTGNYGPLNGGRYSAGQGTGFGMGTSGGYGIGGARGSYLAFSLRGKRADPATARIVIVADRATSISNVASMVVVLNEPIAVAVRGANGDGALAVTLERGAASDGAQYLVMLGSVDADIVASPGTGGVQMPPAPTGAIANTALEKTIADLLAAPGGAGATVSLQLTTHALHADLVLGIDAVASGTQAIPVSVRAGSYGLRSRNDGLPQVRIGQPNSMGSMDKAIIRRYIKRNIQKLSYCYEKELLVKPGLEGTVTVEFVIGPNGNVVQSKATGMNNKVASCIAEVIKAIEFPKDGGGINQVTYPFTFRPTDG